MKSNKLSLIAISLILVFLCSGIVSALSQNDAQVSVVGLSQPVRAGETVTVRITFTSSSNEQLRITKLGLHFDWMAPNQFYTKNFDTPITVPAMGSYVFDAMAIQIPPYATIGSQSYYVAIDGAEGSSLTPFAWDSPAMNIEVIPMSQSGATPTASPGVGGQQDNLQSLLPYLAVAVVIVVVVIVVLLMVMRKKRSQAQQPSVEQPSGPSPIEPQSGDSSIPPS